MIVDETEIPALVQALVAEIATKVETLADHGQPDTLDLRGLPLLPGDYALLKTLLGTGEVTATVSALGPTRIHETLYPGVWWVTYCNESEEVIGEIIEITVCPSLLISDNEEIRAGVARLRDTLSN
jgi:hydrogenase-1 operon protein HyaF